ncbi:MAG: ATP-binding protein [Minicystis sp.]
MDAHTPPDPPATGAQHRLGEEPHALLSVLQELTVAALSLFDPKTSADVFLDRLAERLGCYAALLFEIAPGGEVTLQSSSGLSPASRGLSIPVTAARAIAEDRPACDLPYPELSREPLERWSFPVTDPDRASPDWALVLCWSGDPKPKQLRGMVRRLVGILQTVLVHRNLLARTIESERRLDEQKTLLECVSEVSKDAILVVARDGRVVFHNQRFLDACNLGDERAPRSIAAVLCACKAHGIDPTTCIASGRHLVEHADVELHDEVKLSDGRVFARYSAPVKNAFGTYYGRGLYCRDITEQKRAEAERERLLSTEQAARAEAEEAIHARDEFLSIASHELRTPLTSMQLVVQSAIQAVRDAPDAEPRLSRRSLECIERQARRLNKLIDALLDVSLIQEGRLELEREETDLVAITRDVLSRFGDELRRSGSSLSFRAAAPVVGAWDRSRLDQVVTNLISNAIKYGRGEPIEVSIEAHHGRARLVVRDRGLGIPKEHMPQMFKRFERAVSARHYGGLGLGLHIVRQIVDMHGGAVAVESEPGAGSIFTVDLPLQIPIESPADGHGPSRHRGRPCA